MYIQYSDVDRIESILKIADIYITFANRDDGIGCADVCVNNKFPFIHQIFWPHSRTHIYVNEHLAVHAQVINQLSLVNRNNNPDRSTIHSMRINMKSFRREMK